MSVHGYGNVVTFWPAGKLPPWGSFEPRFEGRCVPEWGYRNHDGEWVEDGRSMTLFADFSFFDSRGVEWFAPTGSVINGFSIPMLLWNPLTGTPFTGKGRRSSVIHDVACQQKSRPWQDVHRAFKEGCRADGMSRMRAALYGGIVYRLGPEWELSNG
jgi:hypothetical protein